MSGNNRCKRCLHKYMLPEEEKEENLPRLLICGHVFCESCLRTLTQFGKAIVCPQCRVETALKENEGAENLQVEICIAGLVCTAKMSTRKKINFELGDTGHGLEFGEWSETSDIKNEEEISELDNDMSEALDEALWTATTNLLSLKTTHKKLVGDLHAQIKREKLRLVQEIEEAFNKATTILTRRKVTLLGEIENEDVFFSSSRERIRSVEDKKRDLDTAIQMGKQIKQFPVLVNYCDVKKVISTLNAPLDEESLDSVQQYGSGLSCGIQIDDLIQSVQSCIWISAGIQKLLPPEETEPMEPIQPVCCPVQGFNRSNMTTCISEGKMSAKAPGKDQELFVPIKSETESYEQRKGTAMLNTFSSPNVIIEEIIEEGEPPVAEIKPPNIRQKPKKMKERKLAECAPFFPKKVFQEWVYVTHVINPNHFYVRRVAEKKLAATLSNRINTICIKDSCVFNLDDVLEIGAQIFIKCKANTWCRATVAELVPGDEDCQTVVKCMVSEVGRIQAFLDDYGYMEELTVARAKGISETKPGQVTPPSSLVEDLTLYIRKPEMVKPEMRRVASLAIRCSLKDIIPAGLEKGWREEARTEFIRVVGNKVVEMRVFGDDGDSLLVDLKKSAMDKMASDMPISLREYLVFLELARFYSPLSGAVVTMSNNKRPVQYCLPVYPEMNVDFNAVVSHVASPSEFYIQHADNVEFLILMAKIQDFYCKGEDGLEMYCPYQDQACVALFEDDVWYRARIIGFPGSRAIEVKFVDFGNTSQVSINHIRKIKDDFFVLPEMAIQCSLADVKPLNSADEWSKESNKRFRELTEDRLMCVSATATVTRKKLLLVKLYNSQDTTDISEVLVKENLARFRKTGLEACASFPKCVEVWDPPIEESVEGPGPDIQAISALQKARQQKGAMGKDVVTPLNHLLETKQDLKVRVTHVTSPGSFFVQLLSSDSLLKRLQSSLDAEYLNSKPEEVEWKEKINCAVLANGIWQRGEICSILPENTVEVLCFDFGNKVVVGISKLRNLKEELIYGSLALECCLSDIRPAGGSEVWTATACDFISYYLTGALALMSVKEEFSEWPLPVTLYCPNKAGQDVSIAEYLISEGLALKERKVTVVHKALEINEKSVEDPQKEPCVATKRLTAKAGCEPECDVLAPQSTAPQSVKSEPYRPPVLPSGKLCQMVVASVGDDGIIYGMTKNAEKEFEQLVENIQQHVKSLGHQQPYTWKLGEGCAVRGSDMLWHRGKVLEVFGGCVKVRYIDQGFIEKIPVCHIFPTVLFEDVPQLCIPCQLYGLLPVGNVWQPDAVHLLKELLQHRYVDVDIMELPKDPKDKMLVQIHFDGMSLSTIMEHHQHAVQDKSVMLTKQPILKSADDELEDFDFSYKGLEMEEPAVGFYTYPVVPDQGKLFPVIVKHLETPNVVYITLDDMQDKLDAEDLKEALERVNQHADSLPLLSDFSAGAPCLAKYSDGKYYRAKLAGFENLNPVKLLIIHVDFGSMDTLTTDRLRQIPAELLDFPCQAIKVNLAGFRPSDIDDETERVPYKPEWSLEALWTMLSLLQGKKLLAFRVSKNPELTVYLYDGRTLVHVPFVESGFAEYD
ncbi:RING finger protein 17 isoform X2 [Acipenser ruthenus]|uniref:RING finger protein 17 isoform X2 n=1 Tax=Acipenser ruthenus TaxID=7906 RepID=UPI002741C6F2|nr:RING finger protein 17 isoform X2 [Acipenser ruthenus]